MKNGIELIAEERQRQIEKEGFDKNHDTLHRPEELTMAAIAYAMPEWLRWTYKGECEFWPFEKESFKTSPENRIRELAKAGALIAAEIDRFQSTGICYVFDEKNDTWEIKQNL